MKICRWTNKRIQENPDGTKYAAFDFELAEHAGTHIDAPYHFKEDGTTVDKIPLHKFFTTGKKKSNVHQKSFLECTLILLSE